MGIYEFKFPDVGEGITEGEIVKWKIKPGQSVKENQVIAEIETDKAVVEIPSPVSGKVKSLGAKQGQVIKVGSTLVTFEVKGEIKKEKKSVSVIGEFAEAGAVLPAPVQSKSISKIVGVRALPAVRVYASQHGIDLSKIKGSGPNGIITMADVAKGSSGITAQDAAIASYIKSQEEGPKKVKKYDMYGYVDRIQLKGIRRTIANNMVTSATKIPHVTHMDKADVTKLWEIRKSDKLQAEKKNIKITFMPYIIKALIQTLKEHPTLNSSIDEETSEIIIKKYYNLGIAVDTEDGLMVPVVKGADQKNMLQIAKEISELADKARTRKIDLQDLKGSTFTITNVGSLGGLFATPIINYPEAAILALGKIQEEPVVVHGALEIRKLMPFSLTFDHRILDGAEAARFANRLIELLGDPKKINAKL
ncbi:MAG: dihydrolipoamide acetyltransferase family protein [Candidatus Nanoarchaeia archaeon]|nr:dihydrolipoamide acetyltransferase family protein [Candidatus Nanoarchaeia archaeon]